MTAMITVLLPTYNPDPNYLRAALDGVLEQTVSDWELFIHDDCSEVDVRSMIESFLNDPRIHFQRSDHRLGIGGNWNACLKLGSGDFVQFLFQDDLWHPAYLEKALAAFTDNRIGFVTSHHQYQFDGSIDPERIQTYQALEADRLASIAPGRNDNNLFLKQWIRRGLRPNLIGEPSFVMLKRSLIHSVGRFRENMPQGLDVEYWLRCLVRSDFAFVPESQGKFRVHPAGASMHNDLSGQGLYDRLGCFDTLLRELPGGELKHLTKQSLIEQFAQMRQKFFGRIQKGNRVGSSGSGSLFRIILGHPILILRALFK